MSLKRFREENKKKNQIIIFTIVCIMLITGVFLYQSYALFEAKDNFNVVSGNMENPGDLSFAFYVNDEIVLEAPSKESNLALSEKSNCTNGVTVSWNVDSWNASVDYSNYKQENTSKTKCNLFFRDAMYSDYITSCGENGNTAVDCMKKYSDKDTINLAYDETVDNNLRYIGSDPNNYVLFNNELWRMIGVMENIDDGTGNKEARIKLIRDEPIGNYPWDSSETSVNGGQGINEWSQADIMKLMNPGYEKENIGGSIYWNQKNGSCYTAGNNVISDCDFSTIGIDDNSKKFIDKALWNTGATDLVSFASPLKFMTKRYYQLERGTNKGNICKTGYSCNDTVQRTTSWIGNVGLIYPSDYGYATSGGPSMNRANCLMETMDKWGDMAFDDCKNNDWLYSSNKHRWTIAPNAYEGHSCNVVIVTSSGQVSGTNAWGNWEILPTIYLKSSNSIISGNGTEQNPYQITLN